jgi:CHAT domain-containing protein
MYAATSGFAPLPQAQAEVAALAKLYRAVALDAEMMVVSALLGAQIVRGSERVGAEAVHFAAHGEVDPTRPESAALFLSDGLPLKPSLFRRSALGEKHRPFLFLNACMVGTAGEALGDADGFPGNCLKGGFRALLAPLWAVDDEVAHDFALEFYRRAFGIGGKPEPVGTILRDLRQQYDGGEEGSKVHTYMAYVFYGHPELTLKAAWAN